MSTLTTPRILVVIAGVNSARRMATVATSMRGIAAHVDDGSLVASCLLYVYGQHVTALVSIAEQVPLCRCISQQGSLLYHLLSVPAAEGADFSGVFVMPSSVMLSHDVSLPQLWRILEANQLHTAAPACSTCKTKRAINHQYKEAVGREMEFVDLQATLFTRNAFSCLQRLANTTIERDHYACVPFRHATPPSHASLRSLASPWPRSPHTDGPLGISSQLCARPVVAWG